MKAIGYVRVSTDKQGISLEAQAEKIKAMALVQGTELIETIVESESAKSLHRPGMAKLLAAVDKGKVQAIIVAKLDRLTGAIPAARCGPDLGCRIARYRLRGWKACAEHHGGGFAVGAGSYRGAHARCAQAQAQKWRAGGQYPIRLSPVRRSAARRARPRRTGRADRNPEPAAERPDPARDCCRSKPPGATRLYKRMGFA